MILKCFKFFFRWISGKYLLPPQPTRRRYVFFSLDKQNILITSSTDATSLCLLNQGWEFMKEKKKVRKLENTHASTQKRTRSRKHALVHARVHAKKNSGKKTRTQTRVRVCVDAYMFSCPSSFFAWTLSCTSACFLERVLFLRGRVRVFLFSCINSQLRGMCSI